MKYAQSQLNELLQFLQKKKGLHPQMYFSRKKNACWRSDKAPIEIEKEDIFTL